MLTSAIIDLTRFCRASSLAFLLLLNFLFTWGYFISVRVEIFSTWVEIFHIVAIFLYRIEISIRIESLRIIDPLVNANKNVTELR